jgi:serine phosphatase RsbU (regulator of sigma subunit)
MVVPPLPRPEASGPFLETYTRGLSTTEIERLFTFDAPEAYRLFTRYADREGIRQLPWHRRAVAHARMIFLGFTLRLAPARRALYAVALILTGIGAAELMQGISLEGLPHPVFASGTWWVLTGFLLLNLIVMLEVADRLSLKNDLEVAREIQLAMLPRGVYQADCVEAFGMTRPANTVGGDFYDILPRADGTILLALGDVAGKGSPAALLMALLVAMLRTLSDEGLDGAPLVSRLNAQLCKHAPRSRFVTLFLASLNPATGELVYVNAGHLPPLVRRAGGSFDRLDTGGMALGIWDHASYTSGRTHLASDDLLVAFSDGITEAENAARQPFDDAGLQSIVSARTWATSMELGWEAFAAVEHHVGTRRLHDDLTILVVRRLLPVPGVRS